MIQNFRNMNFANATKDIQQGEKNCDKMRIRDLERDSPKQNHAFLS